MRIAVWILVASLTSGCAGLWKPGSSANATAEKEHRIGSGETLSEISKQYQVPVKQILQANPKVEDADQIREGWVLTIPASIDKSSAN